MTYFSQMIKKIYRNLIPSQEYVSVSGSVIPAPDRRWCGQEFKNDAYYLKSAEGEAERIVKYFQCDPETRVLDIGCGQGRLPIGILRVIGEIDYLGIDVDERSINWCKKYIEQTHPTFKFQHLNLYNERYNKSGIRIDDRFKFDLESSSFDIIYLFSVFSHMTEEDMKIYLKEFSRVLTTNGRIFFSTFIEDDVPDITINPDTYQLKCSGPLHIVRYRKEYLFSILNDLGYSIYDFTHGTEADGQSAVYLEKMPV